MTYELLESPRSWKSAVVTGELTKISEEEELTEAFAVMANNADFSSLRMSEMPMKDVNFSMIKMEIDEMGGRTTTI